MLETVTGNVNKMAHSVEEVSELTSLSKDFLRKEIREKKLKAKLVGRRVLILNADLQNWLEGKENWTKSDERKTNEVKNNEK